MNMSFDKVKELIQKAGPFRIGVVAVSGILLILISYGGTPGKTDGGEEKDVVTETAEVSADQETYRERMEMRVKSILEEAEGVGKADVMITLKASGEKVTLKDNSVDSRGSEEETVLIEDGDKNTSPYIVQESEPEIEGILIVCTGGDEPSVQREIIAGISALFPVESHKIKVMKSKEAK